MPFRLDVTIQSDTRYLAPLRQLVDAAATVVGESRFPAEARRAVSLALIEAVDNAIFHAHHRRSELPIRVGLTIAERYVRVEVGDCGEGIDHEPRSAPAVDATRGRGLFLMQELMGHVESVVKGGVHWIRMTHRL